MQFCFKVIKNTGKKGSIFNQYLFTNISAFFFIDKKGNVNLYYVTKQTSL